MEKPLTSNGVMCTLKRMRNERYCGVVLFLLEPAGFAVERKMLSSIRRGLGRNGEPLATTNVVG